MKNQRKTRPTSLAALCLLGVCAVLLGQAPNSQEPDALNAIRNDQPAFLVRAEVNHQTRDYREGDYLSVRVASEVDSFVYVLYQESDGKVRQIFPNRVQPDNRVRAR